MVGGFIDNEGESAIIESCCIIPAFIANRRGDLLISPWNPFLIIPDYWKNTYSIRNSAIWITFNRRRVCYDSAIRRHLNWDLQTKSVAIGGVAIDDKPGKDR